MAEFKPTTAEVIDFARAARAARQHKRARKPARKPAPSLREVRLAAEAARRQAVRAAAHAAL